MHRDGLTSDELNGVVDLLLAAPGQSQQEYILDQPRQALEQARHESGWAWDPRLSPTGNRLAKRLSDILESLGRIESWLRHQGRPGLTPLDRSLLTPPFTRLARDAQSVATLADDFIGELHVYEPAKSQ